MKKDKQKIILLVLIGLWWVGISAYENGYLDFIKFNWHAKPKIEKIGEQVEKTFCTGPDEKIVKITRVVDGDTYNILLADEEDTVRLVGINTPEKKGPYRQEECYGKEATQYAQKWLNQEACFVPDGGPVERDKYNRLLGYLVLRDRGDIGEDLIKNGFGKVYIFHGRDFKNKKKYQQNQEEAKKDVLGIWKVCP